MKGTRPGKLPPPNHAEAPGRVCAEPGCDTDTVDLQPQPPLLAAHRHRLPELPRQAPVSRPLLSSSPTTFRLPRTRI